MSLKFETFYYVSQQEMEVTDSPFLRLKHNKIIARLVEKKCRDFCATATNTQLHTLFKYITYSYSKTITRYNYDLKQFARKGEEEIR